MKKTILLFLAAAALPAAAQSFSAALSYGQFQTSAQTVGGAATAEGQQNFGQYAAGTLGAVGVHLSWAAVSLGPLALEVTGAYQAPARKDLTVTTWGTLPGVAGTLGTSSASAQFRESSAGVGLRLASHLLVDWSVGLEGRSESLRLAGPGGTLSTTLTRPWLEAGVGYTFPSPFLKPFVAVTGALALSKIRDDGSFDPKLVQSLSPKAELALQAGLRF